MMTAKHWILPTTLLSLWFSAAACSDDDSPNGEADAGASPDSGAIDGGANPDSGAPDGGFTVTTPTGPAASLFDGNLVGADYWSDQPAILSAGVGFSDIVGVPGDTLTEELVRQAGGAWSTAANCGDDLRNLTSTSLADDISGAFIRVAPFSGFQDGAIGLDGLPVVFSWPMDTSTLDPDDFRLTLSTGEVVQPQAAGPFPCVENNERNVAVIFGEFSNRLPSTESGSRFPVRVEVVDSATPLILVGPGGQTRSAVGLSWETTTSPYDPDNGPRLVGAKLNRIGDSVLGEGVSVPASDIINPPNDELLLYDEGDFKIRVLTTGGFSPDGVTGVRPDDFETFFRIHATDLGGQEVIMDRVGETYRVLGGSLRVVGLSELGEPEGGRVVYDGCYNEDLDNYIDIVLVGDEAAARNITFVEIPSLAGEYSAFYNPGGPGTTPFNGVVYTSPGPPDLEPVIIALDDPMRVTRRAN